LSNKLENDIQDITYLIKEVTNQEDISYIKDKLERE